MSLIKKGIMYGAALLVGGFLWANEAKAEPIRQIDYDQAEIITEDVNIYLEKDVYFNKTCEIEAWIHHDLIEMVDESCKGPKKGAIDSMDSIWKDNMYFVRKNCKSKKCKKMFKKVDKLYAKLWKNYKVDKLMDEWENYDRDISVYSDDGGFKVYLYDGRMHPRFEYKHNLEECTLKLDWNIKVVDKNCDGLKNKKLIDKVYDKNYGDKYSPLEEYHSKEINELKNAYVKLTKMMGISKYLKKWPKENIKEMTQNIEELLKETASSPKHPLVKRVPQPPSQKAEAMKKLNEALNAPLPKKYEINGVGSCGFTINPKGDKEYPWVDFFEADGERHCTIYLSDNKLVYDKKCNGFKGKEDYIDTEGYIISSKEPYKNITKSINKLRKSMKLKKKIKWWNN